MLTVLFVRFMQRFSKFFAFSLIAGCVAMIGVHLCLTHRGWLAMFLGGGLTDEDPTGHLLSPALIVAYSVAVYQLFDVLRFSDAKTELSEPILETAVRAALLRVLGIGYITAHIALDCQLTLGAEEYTRLLAPIFCLALPTLLLCCPLMLLQLALMVPIAAVSLLLGCGIPWLMAIVATVLSVATNGLLAYKVFNFLQY